MSSDESSDITTINSDNELNNNNNDHEQDIESNKENNEKNNEEDNKEEDEEKKVVSNEFKEKILGYIKIDDLIRIKMEEIKELKEKKELCEEYILKNLDKNESNFINIPGGKLIKNQSETKGPLKSDVIKEAIIDGLKKDNITNEENTVKVVEDILTLMEEKRGKVNRVNLKRTYERVKKKREPKKKKN